MLIKLFFILAAFSLPAFGMMPEDGSPMPQPEPGTVIIQ